MCFFPYFADIIHIRGRKKAEEEDENSKHTPGKWDFFVTIRHIHPHFVILGICWIYIQCLENIDHMSELEDPQSYIYYDVIRNRNIATNMSF